VNIRGTVFLLGDDVSSDLLYPGRYLTVSDRAEQARHALEGFGEEWPERLRGHAVLGAGWNLGCGSSREQAATALLAAGVQLVVARSMSRLFLRNCINNGLAVIESDELAAALVEGITLSADLASGTARIGEKEFHFTPLPEALLEIVRDGGLLARLRHRLHRDGRT
jgi:3-isopropylmalate/(R)-2-methylmalate dehydratase small subunit